MSDGFYKADHNAKQVMRLNLALLICLICLACSEGQMEVDRLNLTTKTKDTFQQLPGTDGLAIELIEKYTHKRQTRGNDYVPRTKHLNSDGWAIYTNRLFLESSPYLLQHAHNPVDWYPWGDEAFERATALNRPVLLSVGYSTCHWCHVMEAESFEDVEIARYINANYIAIKVDREERPDVDAVYMAAVQALTGRGGWPMTVWMTPDRLPFYGGSYYPARDGDRGLGVGFLTLLKKIKESYHSRKDLVDSTSNQLTNAINQMLSADMGAQLPGEGSLHNTFQAYQRSFDSNHGGLSSAPKFPSSLSIRFLLRYSNRFDNETALQMATLTLDKMAGGGLYDHVGGGFHRYATDERWLVPHFEKMLYDNALLVQDYLEAFQLTGNPSYQHIVRRVLDYVLGEMTSPQGAFYSATDADSLTPAGHREEGYYFTWTSQEIEDLLGSDLAKLIKTTHGVGPIPNFEGRHILHTPEPLTSTAKQLNLAESDLRARIDTALKSLYAERQKRPAPLRDEKILTAWNGLMISALAKAGFVLEEPIYVQAAERAATFILDYLLIDGRLKRSHMDGVSKHNAYLDDYAFLAAAFIDLYEATHDIRWLQQAIALDETLARFHEDLEGGGFFMTSNDHEKLIAREKPNHDGALPSGNAVATMNLIRLAAFTSDSMYLERAQRAFLTFANILASNPTAMAELQLAFDSFLHPPKEVALIEPDKAPGGADLFLDIIRHHYLPGRVLAKASEGQDLKNQSNLIPFLQHKEILNNKATAFVCQNKICKRPTDDVDIFTQQLQTADTRYNKARL